MYTKAILSIASLAYFVFVDVFRFLSVLTIVQRFFVFFFHRKTLVFRFSGVRCGLPFFLFFFFLFFFSIWLLDLVSNVAFGFLNLVSNFFVHSIKVNMLKLEYARSFGTTGLHLNQLLASYYHVSGTKKLDWRMA